MDMSPAQFPTLAEIRARSNRPIAQELVEIARLKNPRPRRLKTLQCLALTSGLGRERNRKRQRLSDGHAELGDRKLQLSRRVLDLSSTSSDYVAVSWTWGRPSGEDPTAGGYEIESHTAGGGFVRSSVVDAVLDRALRYAAYVGCPNICEYVPNIIVVIILIQDVLLRLPSSAVFCAKILTVHNKGIDKECLDQDDPVKKEQAIQSMDLVYSRCKHAVALLSVSITSEKDLNLLRWLLYGELASEGDSSQSFKFRLEAKGSDNADHILALLRRITSDSWWNRAWTFQEDYKAGVKMALMFPSLQHSGLGPAGVFGRLPGELCINSADFRRETTRFCLAYKNSFGPNDACNTILQLAGKYTELLRDSGVFGAGVISCAMSPTIFSDVTKRGITKREDVLAITANCCSYATRIDTELLRQQGKSIDLGMIALFLLNGEIMDNDNTIGKLPDALSGNALGFLRRQSFNRFEAPGHKELQFFKGCRFPYVDLTQEGIKTCGYLWKTYRLVQGEPIPRRSGKNSEFQWQQLAKFAEELEGNVYGQSHQTLADNIRKYVDDWQDGASSLYTDLMAGEVIEAIQDGQRLDLALAVNPILTDRESRRSSCWAVFVRSGCDSGGDDREELYYFTAETEANKETGHIPTHVSLVVELQGSSERQPILVVKGWADALCFPTSEYQQEVTLPWPASLVV